MPSEHDKLKLDVQDEVSLTGFLRQLIQQESLSSQERKVAELIIKELKKIGVEDIKTDAVGNIIARIGNGDGPTLLYDAHMDTVAPADGWKHEPFAATIKDGVLHGLGSCDMKGSLAAMVYAAKKLIDAKTPLHGTLALVFVVQEEPCEGCALKACIEAGEIKPDWVLLGEPSNLDVMLGHRGRVLLKVTVRGKSSHGSTPELGENAITAAARLIFGIDMLDADLATDPFLGRGTVAVTHIESHSVSMNAIPDRCAFYIDRRLTLGETPTRALAEVDSIIQREGHPAEVEIVEYQQDTYTGHPIHSQEAFNPWRLDDHHELAQSVRQSVEKAIGKTPNFGHWAFSTDGVYSMAEAGIPTIGFGPGDPRYAHTNTEHIRLEDLTKATYAYALIAANLLGKKK